MKLVITSNFKKNIAYKPSFVDRKLLSSLFKKGVLFCNLKRTESENKTYMIIVLFTAYAVKELKHCSGGSQQVALWQMPLMSRS